MRLEAKLEQMQTFAVFRLLIEIVHVMEIQFNIKFVKSNRLHQRQFHEFFLSRLKICSCSILLTTLFTFAGLTSECELYVELCVKRRNSSAKYRKTF